MYYNKLLPEHFGRLEIFIARRLSCQSRGTLLRRDCFYFTVASGQSRQAAPRRPPGVGAGHAGAPRPSPHPPHPQLLLLVPLFSSTSSSRPPAAAEPTLNVLVNAACRFSVTVTMCVCLCPAWTAYFITTLGTRRGPGRGGTGAGATLTPQWSSSP